jgi:hypothetical protein
LGTAFEIKVTLTDDPNNTSGGPNDYGFAQQIIINDNYFGGFAPTIAGFHSIISIFYLDLRAVPIFTWSEVPKNLVISNNIFDGTDLTNAGVSTTNGISLGTCEGVVIEGNIFRNMSVNGAANNVSSCLNVTKSRNIVISNNVMSIREGTGISIQEECDRMIIDGNLIVQDPGSGAIPDFGINMRAQFSGTLFLLTNSTISNNTIQASLACLRGLNNGGSMSNLIVTGNNFDNECLLDIANKCTITNNILGVKSTRFKALGIGYAGGIVAYNLISNNTINALTNKNGIEISRCRSSIISQNIIHTPLNAMTVGGTNTAGELDYLTIKDNYSVNQASPSAFPLYTAMNAADTATLVVANNQKVT